MRRFLGAFFQWGKQSGLPSVRLVSRQAGMLAPVARNAHLSSLFADKDYETYRIPAISAAESAQPA
jgi:hypothetical protein